MSGMCRRGHEMSGDNVHVNSRGKPVCRACNRSRLKSARERAKEIGEAKLVAFMSAADLDRFWEKVHHGNDCWPWRAATNGVGYGVFYLGGRQLYAHRVAYRLAGGVIEDGLALDHACRNRGCVRAIHLRPVTVGVNVLIGVGPSATNANKTVCANGHAFNDSNTNHTVDGTRRCRECNRQRVRGVRARRIAANAAPALGPRLCHRCGELKPTVDFIREHGKADGWHWNCKACNNELARASRARGKEKAS
jgi:hypothetical protein